MLDSGELVYYVAAVAIIYDKQRHKQRHYTGHNEDISWLVKLIKTYQCLLSYSYEYYIMVSQTD